MYERMSDKEAAPAMQEQPFWEQTYADMDVSTFCKGPTVDVNEFITYSRRIPKCWTSAAGRAEIPSLWLSLEIL